ncbi:MAG: thymidine kinase [Clostridia bacterium]|nr:thymidine kinase [Clostridia bacterium]
MAKLYFKYGAMGSSKTAQALITRFNYIEMGMRVWLIKPSSDTRDGASIVMSRIGLSAPADVIYPENDIYDLYNKNKKGETDVIIADEAQFFTPDQIDQLHEIATWEDIPVLCFGLRTDFMLHFFPGSKRLLELAESITEIKTICQCGSKATVNVRFDPDGRVATEGEQIVLGGNETYKAMCYKCMQTLIKEQRK